MTDIEFEERNRTAVQAMAADAGLRQLTQAWLEGGYAYEYSYHFKWMGLPIIQYPQDIVALQEIVWDVQPDAIVEIGIARGGSLIFYASLLEMMGAEGIVIGVDIDIRPPNRQAVEEHRLSKRITMIEGSSVDPEVVALVGASLKGRKKVLLVLDSNHTHDHVLEELNLYSPIVSEGSYLIVFDTIVEYMPEGTYPNRPWGPGNSPLSAVHAFLATNDGFQVDRDITDKLLITAAPGGYLRRVSD